MIVRRIRAKTRAVLIGKAIRAVARADLVRLGSSYGGWWIPRDALHPGSICYLAGVGEDVSFDLALIKEVGCEVWALDPTPRAIAYAATVSEPRFHFIPEGLWSDDAELRFYEPTDPSHVSHSVRSEQHGDGFFVARVRGMRSLMSSLGHEKVDLLKMDIEGAEVEVIEDLIENGPFPSVLCVEFDAPEPVAKTLLRVRRLRRLGYVPVMTEGLNATFVLENSPEVEATIPGT